jgi:predicted AlkP superfamily pyrophosphatase or phosphodiesterase
MINIKKLVAVFVSSVITACSFAQPAKHVILISVDGLRPDFYMDTTWHTDNMRALMKDGAYAKGVNSVFPSMTYPSHTTMITGVQPAKHGVYFNAMFEPNGPTGKIYWNDSSIHAPTLWEAAQQKGLTTAALLWPVSADAPVTYNIPDIGSLGEKVREQYSRPAGFVDTLKTIVFNGAEKIEYGTNVNVARIAAYVIQQTQPALMTIHFFAVDHAEHIEGRNGEMVKEAVLDADSGVAVIVKALKDARIWDSSVVIVTGDHGFVDVKTTLNPNVWLKEKGLCNDVKQDDWKAQFFTVGGSAYLYVKNNDPQVISQVKTILNELPAEKKNLFAIVDRKKLDAVGANPEVPLALTGLNGTSFGGAFTGEDVKPGKGGAHGYFPDFKDIQTGFVAYGPGIKKGTVIPEMDERDICSIVASLLGLSFPGATGKVPAGLMSSR